MSAAGPESPERPAKKAAKGRPQGDRVLQDYATQIRTLARKGVQDVIAIGKVLTKAQKRVGRGNWLPWLERELGWSDDTARNYMAVHRLSLQPKFRKFRHYWHRVAPSVLYMLAREGLSDETFDEVMQRIAAGEKITPAAAKKYVTVQVTSTGETIYPLYRKDSELPTCLPPDPSLPWRGFRSSQQGEPSAEPSPTDVPSEPLLQIPPPIPPGRDQDLPQIDLHQAFVDGSAKRLIDELAHSRPDIRERAVALVLGERAIAYDLFAQAVRELADGLNRTSAARKTGMLRLIASDPETPR